MKKALVVVSFGTTFKETREKDLEAVENALKNVFPDRDFYRAYTARIVVKRLMENDGIKVLSLEETLQALSGRNYDDVLIQMTHVTMGEEYAKKIMSVAHNFKNSFRKFSVGRPLLSDDFDYSLVTAALSAQLPALEKNQAVIYMGHGSPNMHNPSYNILEKRFNKAGITAIVGVVEEDDHPNFAEVLSELKKRNIEKVLLTPLLLVCGDHVCNDMAGEDDASWANMLKAQGYEVVVRIGGLGRIPAIQNIYVMHALAALA